MNDSRRREFLKVAGGVAVVGSLAGCAGEAQEDEEGGQPEGEQPEEEPGQEEEPQDEQPQEEEEEEPEEGTGDDLIRVAHMIPDFPEVDIYIDGGEEPVISDLDYTEVTDYVELPAGDHQIRVTAAGARALTVFDEQVSMPSGNTTAVALGSSEEAGNGNGQEEGDNGQQAGGAEIDFQLELFSDDNTPPEESINNARLRLIHASPDAPAINVLVGQTAVFEDVSFGEAEYFDLPAGDYEFNIVPADGGMANGGENGSENESGENGENGEDNGLFSSLAADGGSEISFLQEDENETDPEQEEGEEEPPEDEEPPEEDEELPEEGEEEPPEDEEEPVFSFDASIEENSVYTAFAAGYLDAEAANSDAEFEVVVTQDVIDGEVAEAEDDE